MYILYAYINTIYSTIGRSTKINLILSIYTFIAHIYLYIIELLRIYILYLYYSIVTI